jgi:hypothetical protein
VPRSPEEAARGDIPRQYAAALGVEVSPDGQHAAVLLGTNEEPVLYPYVVVCDNVEGEWVEGIGGNAPGLAWSSIGGPDEREHVGVLMFTGEAPPDAQGVVIRWRDIERTVSVSHGYFLFAAWNIVPGDRGEWPEIVSFVP